MRAKSHVTSAFSFLILIAMIWYAFESQTPSSSVKNNLPENEWSTARALTHVRELSKEPHYVGSPTHETNRIYIKRELEKMGLKVEIQTGFTIDEYGNLARPSNIISRIPGTGNTGNAIALMTHYDSDPHSSLGASDAASGVATILEGVRAYLTDNKPVNDIIILITDAEEIGLNGADYFVNNHRYTDDIKMILNFESRGSGGPSYMLVETNGGNREIINAFKEADVDYPVANSLAYSIYKKLPNDTDLTVMREDGDINGLNFAFIGDHIDYHTQLDNYENLDRNTLAHQGSYLMPLLSYFASTDLSDGYKTEVGTDDIYFPLPILGMVSYPFSWMSILIIVSGIVLLALIIYGFVKKRISVGQMLLGFVPFLGSLALAYLVPTFTWQTLRTLPFYLEQPNVFPATGYLWIAAAAFFGIAVAFLLYHLFYKKTRVASHSVAPLILLWIICLIVAFPVGDSGLIPAAYLPGAGFFIVPLISGLFLLWLNIYQKRPSYIIMLLLAIPVIFIFVPFIAAFPVALGMNILFVAAVLTVLVFGLLVPILGHYRKKNVLAFLSFILCGVFVVLAFTKAEFSTTSPQKTSLVYLFDADSQTAQWATYDNNLSDWTKQKLGDKPQTADEVNENTVDSKYNGRFTYVNRAQPVNLPEIENQITADSTVNGLRTIKLLIRSDRKVERWEVFRDPKFQFTNAIVNGVEVPKDENGVPFSNRRNSRIISYYVSNKSPLVMELTFDASQSPEFDVYAASFDLLEQPAFGVSARPENAMPMPFVLNDAVVVQKHITTNPTFNE
ncbi:Peptidase family M28 [Nonlabens sp. Hel1_33_55]|uniref:M28 family peptidase n=1 Tax=Nonlabens sp. Hel1_33_55 TaxID=1336802 RepID=UPI000875B3E3|nr:M28 family peptidase [Nonlabens sp. Hel1_33_55]SCY29026.1 Peptidase family M28 [Nonlabens sp. Hel1_33_55]